MQYNDINAMDATSGSTSSAVSSSGFPRFCDISGHTCSVFDDLSGRDGDGIDCYDFDDNDDETTKPEELLRDIRLEDTSRRRVYSLGDLEENQWRQQALRQQQQQQQQQQQLQQQQQPNLIEVSLGRHQREEMMMPRVVDNAVAPFPCYQDSSHAYVPVANSYNNDYSEGAEYWQSPSKRELFRSQSVDSSRRPYHHDQSYLRDCMVDDSMNQRMNFAAPADPAPMSISDPFEERVDRVLGAFNSLDAGHSSSSSLPTSTRRSDWMDYQRHSEPADIGSPRRKKRASIRNLDEDTLTMTVPPTLKKLKSDDSFSSADRPSRKTTIPENDFVVKVEENDVLLGRGPLVYSHMGNQKFHDEKKRLQKAYLSAPNAEKKTISQELVDIIQATGGNFLKFDFGTKRWHRVDNETARAKAAQALREDYTKEDRKIKREKYKMRTKQRSKSTSSSEPEATAIAAV